MDMEGKCRFGAGGKAANGKHRKQTQAVIDAFIAAFPPEAKDVELEVKCFKDCRLDTRGDARVKLITDFIPDKELGDWHRSLTAFVSMSRGEGWGCFQHQSLACGRPLIAAIYGGVADFANERNSYPAAFVESPSAYDSCYGGIGLWAKVLAPSVIENMIAVYNDRDEARRRGEQGAKDVENLTWANHVAGVIREL